VSVNLKGTIEVRAFFYWALAIIVDFAAPENSLAFVVGTLQFQPSVICIDRTAGEKVSDFLGAHNDIDSNCIAAAKWRLHAVQRRGDRQDFSG